MRAAATAAGATLPSRAGARTAPATTGAASATCATSRAATSGPRPTSPSVARADSYEAMFSEGRAEFRRRDHDYETHTEIVVSPEDDIELRRVRITNRARVRRTIELTSYAEVVLAPPRRRRDAARRSASCSCRPRSCARGARSSARAGRARPASTCHGHSSCWPRARAEVTDVSYETDRVRFIGRGGRSPRRSRSTTTTRFRAARARCSTRSSRSAAASRSSRSNRQRSTSVSGAGGSREACLAADREVPGSPPGGSRVRRRLDAQPGHARARSSNATEPTRSSTGAWRAPCSTRNAALRAESAVLAQNRRGQSGLWGYAISGDLPIVLLQIGDAAQHRSGARQVHARTPTGA